MPAERPLEETNSTPNSPHRGPIDLPDDLEDSITLRPPPTTARTHAQPQRQPRPLANTVDAEDWDATMSQDAPQEEQEMRRPQRIRNPVDFFKPAPWIALMARTSKDPRTLADALASPESMDWKSA